MSAELNLKKINLIKKFKVHIDTFLNLIEKNYVLSLDIKNAQNAVIYLEKLIKAPVTIEIVIIEHNYLIASIIHVIINLFANIIKEDKTITYMVNTKIPNTVFTANYVKFSREYKQIICELDELVTDNIYNNYFKKYTYISYEVSGPISPETIIEITDSFIIISNLYKKYTYAFTVYKNILVRLLAKFKSNIQITTNLLDINEQVKNHIISIPNENIIKNKIPPDDFTKYTASNPYFNMFGLVPISNLHSLPEITNIIFPDSKEDLYKSCIANNYDLIIIKKYLQRGINYNLLDLLDFTKSKEYGQNHYTDDGITAGTISRFSNIKYIETIDKNIDFTIDYNYTINSDANKFIIIIEELYPGHYHILSNVYNFYLQYFVRKALLVEFIKFVTSKSAPRSRIDNYNTIINKGILTNMFAAVKINIDRVTKQAQDADPKTLRFDIYNNIISKYKQLNIKQIKTIFEFSKLLHSDDFIRVFEDTITLSYNKLVKKDLLIYKKNNIEISEVYTRFLYDLNSYSKEFTKKLHDTFISKIVDILKSDIFQQPNVNKEFQLIFNAIIQDILNKIITLEKNIFQSLNYKLYLLQHI